MTPARHITAALRGQWHGAYGMAKCPTHPDGRTPALKISDDPRKSDGIDVHCFGGCDWRDVKHEMVRSGLLPEGPMPARKWPKLKFAQPSPEPADDGRYEAAKDIWLASKPLAGTMAERYLYSRALQPPWPRWLRYAAALKHGPTGLILPGLVAGITDGGGNFVAIHRTYLKVDGSGKAVVSSPKMALGSIGNGAVRLGQAGKALGLAEGIETGLSAQQLFVIPCWAALGSRMDRVDLPGAVVEVQIFGDNGNPGREAAEKAAERFTNQGRRVMLRFPPEPFGDWNDALQALCKESA